MKKIISFIIAFAGLITLSNSIFFVSEYEQVFIAEFGKIVSPAINADHSNEAGLHFKKPFIQQVIRIEKRMLEWDGPATDMPTRDKLYITVDTFARWRISNPIVYYEKLRDERSALSRLDDIIGSSTRNVIAAHDLIEVIRSDKSRKIEITPEIVAANPNITQLPPISLGRNALAELILKESKPSIEAWGIELIDFRFKRINYKRDVIEKIYSRMKSERLQIASKFLSEGEGEAAKIIGRKDRDLQEIESKAYRKEQEIRGKADAEATQIYAEAYNTSPAAADFYQFTKTLETYSKTMGKDSTIILSTDSDLFRLFKESTILPSTGQKTTP